MFSFEGANLKRPQMTYFKNWKTKISIFEYFSPSEMNSTQHFYPILTLKKYLLHRGPRGSQKSKKLFQWYPKNISGGVLLIKEKNHFFSTGCPISAARGCKLNFLRQIYSAILPSKPLFLTFYCYRALWVGKIAHALEG